MNKKVKDDAPIENYNSEFKADYLQNYIGNTAVLKKVYRDVAPFEQKFGKDLCDFSLEEASEYLTAIGSISAFTIGSYVSLIRNYRAECERRDVAKAKIEETAWNPGAITVDDYPKFAKPLDLSAGWVTLTELNRTLSILPNASDRFMLRAFYEGFWGEKWEDVWKAKLTDFNRKNHVVSVASGRKISYSDELLSTAIESSNMIYYVSYKSSIDGKKIPLRQDDSMAIIRWRRSKDTETDDNPDQAYLRIVYRFKALRDTLDQKGSWISPPKLREGGAMEMLASEARKANVSVYDVIASQFFEQVAYQFGLDKISRPAFVRKFKNAQTIR